MIRRAGVVVALVISLGRLSADDGNAVATRIRPFALESQVEQGLKAGDAFRECANDKDYCPQMIVVPAGAFMMGSAPGEKGSLAGERPQHAVRIAKPFAVGKFEITFEEWDVCVTAGGCGRNVSDSGFGRGRRPVIDVTWDDARAYVTWLANATGRPYRLLTEAEYEYAARGGTQTVYPWGNDLGKNNANCNACGSQWDNVQTAPVGSLAPNSFGLHDMAGNVFQWVADCYHETYRERDDVAPADGSAWVTGDCRVRGARGGSWFNKDMFVRSASRVTFVMNLRSPLIGLRVARTLSAR